MQSSARARLPPGRNIHQGSGLCNRLALQMQRYWEQAVQSSGIVEDAVLVIHAAAHICHVALVEVDA